MVLPNSAAQHRRVDVSGGLRGVAATATSWNELDPVGALGGRTHPRSRRRSARSLHRENVLCGLAGCGHIATLVAVSVQPAAESGNRMA
jgi:hypothetical protein